MTYLDELIAKFKPVPLTTEQLTARKATLQAELARLTLRDEVDDLEKQVRARKERRA